MWRPQRLITHVLGMFAMLICAVNGQTGGWISSIRVGDEALFLSSGTVQRYHLATKAWRSTVQLPRTGATAMAADATGAVVAYGSSLYQYAPGFTGETLLGTTSSAVHGLFLDGDLVIAVHS